ncbi:uncharacterized protein LOC124361184 [Homalodisca vitripennis]|uniref:uncharacterized protein LOC124361184 n=1 Tax=Homalodisca vitripennis TaxID=197043 RepID=UPI001EEC87BC|nr:uncharacterized protein LOC124361184 [Homalodisca vitripennis]
MCCLPREEEQEQHCQKRMKVLQHNLNHCELAHDLLTQTVIEMKIDLAIFADPYTRLKTQAWVTDATGKAAIWSCRNRTFEDQVDSTQRWFIRAKLGNVHFYSVYAPPSLDINEFTDLLDRLVEDVKEHSPCVIAGDVPVNAWAVDWGSKKTNTRGTELLRTVSCLDMVFLNRGTTPTFETDNGSSIIDLTIASSNIVRRGNDWTVHNLFNESDHRLISWTVTREPAKNRSPHKTTNLRGWNANKFDAELFQEAFNSEPIVANSAHEETEEVMRRVALACDATMTRKRPKNEHPPMYWWNSDTAKSRQETVQARRKATRARKKPNYRELKESHRAARLKLTKAIKSSKAHCWNELLEEVYCDPWGRPYKVVLKKVKIQPQSSPTCLDLLDRIVTNLFPHTTPVTSAQSSRYR